MPNLAHELNESQGGLLQFPKIERQAMSKKEEGYTKTPNSLIDEQIMAHLSDKAFKCLFLIVRQTIGFDRSSHAISTTQFQKYCGIKKEETVSKVIRELEDCKLITVVRKKGCLNNYTATINQYHQTVVPPSNGSTPTEQGYSTPTEQGYSTPIQRGSNKETFKETFKENKKEPLIVDNFKNNDVLKFIEYHAQDKKEYSLRELTSEYPIQSDFAKQAKYENSELSDEFILSELKSFAQWSVTQKDRTAQMWLNNWIYRIQNVKSRKSKKRSTSSKNKRLSISQIRKFSSKLCQLPKFNSDYSEVGEQQKEFEKRIAEKLGNAENLKKWSSYLYEVGFVGDLENFI